MQWKNGINRFWRIIATFLLVSYSVACTHMPTGEKAFDSFETCFASNLGLAAFGGIGVGILGSKLVKGMTGDKSTGKTIGTAAGVAAATMIAVTAWRKCGAVYNKSEVVAPAAARPSAAVAATSQQPRLSLDRLEVHVEGTENDPPIPEFDFSMAATDPAAKDIKAQFRHRVEIVRFTATNDDRLVLADDKDEPLRDRSGKEIPLEAAARTPRERLSWVPIAEEGKEDYVEDVVIQQGSRARYRHKLQVPPRDKMPLPLPVPMRYTLTVEAENMKATRSVDFAILGTGDRPKRYVSSSQASALTPGQHATAGAPAPAATSAGGSGPATNRKTMLFSNTTAQRKPVHALAKGARVRIEERVTAIVNNKPEAWVKATTDGGMSGWLPASHLSGGK